MTIAEMIDQHVKQLSDSSQLEVLDFIEFLEQKYRGEPTVQENEEWGGMSVGQAMRGMENEQPLYSAADIIQD